MIICMKGSRYTVSPVLYPDPFKCLSVTVEHIRSDGNVWFKQKWTKKKDIEVFFNEFWSSDWRQ